MFIGCTSSGQRNGSSMRGQKYRGKLQDAPMGWCILEDPGKTIENPFRPCLTLMHRKRRCRAGETPESPAGLGPNLLKSPNGMAHRDICER
jgi:hypothetical protein